jgi:hypothetical protein
VDRHIEGEKKKEYRGVGYERMGEKKGEGMEMEKRKKKRRREEERMECRTP